MVNRILNPGPRSLYLVDLLQGLVARDVKLRYKRTVLGVLWSLINPLAQLLVFVFIFGLVFDLNIPNYVVFLFSGLLVWNWFQTSLLAATSSIVENADLIRQPGFPAAILPVTIITTNMLHFLLALPILLILLLFSDLPPTAAWLALPLIIGIQYLFTLSLAYMTSTLHVTFRDMQYLLGIGLMLGFYLSPIFYSPDMIPERWQVIYSLNPITGLLNAYRDVFMYGQWPNFAALGLIALLSSGVLWVSYNFFRRARDRFAEEL